MALGLGPSHPSQQQPFVRSRTNLFLSYRDSLPHHAPATPYPRYDDDDDLDTEEAGLIPHSTTPRIRHPHDPSASSAASLPPRWVDLADKVDDIFLRVKPAIAQLDKLHAKHLLPGFKDRSAEEREIQSLATSITSDFRTCQALIRRIAEQSQALLQSRPRDAVDAEMKRIDLIMAANVQTALATKLQDLSTAFRKKQAEYLRQLKGNESRAVELQNKSTYDPLVALADDEQASRSVLDSSSYTSAPTPSLAQQQLFAPSTSSALSAVDQRTHEITAIAQSIAELADMFKDLSSLVIDQGTLLDRVDWNVEQMGTEVKGAADELRTAARYQRRSGKCQLIFLLVLLVVACLVVLLFRPPRFLSSSSSSSDPSVHPPTATTGGGMATNDEIAQKLTEELDGRRRRTTRRRTRRLLRLRRRRATSPPVDDGDDAVVGEEAVLDGRRGAGDDGWTSARAAEEASEVASVEWEGLVGPGAAAAAAVRDGGLGRRSGKKRRGREWARL
ncbi:t-SNARE syntaxin TLG2 [Rhodotorula paludigena]|uniref:t-SNARE syntaxin TLG2 n=1 Tax=Rhodotorula paludigena TaxID=86838 RepID=UPI0031781442